MKKSQVIQLAILLLAIVITIGSLKIKSEPYKIMMDRLTSSGEIVDQGWPLQFKSTLISEYEDGINSNKNTENIRSLPFKFETPSHSLRYANKINIPIFIINILLLFLLLKGSLAIAQETYIKFKKK